jgi:glycosyltransferase involved in cell wall biosynthesis
MPVRVCFLIDELGRAGTETQLVALIRALDRRRVLPYLCLLRGTSAASRALEPDDCPVLRLGVGSLASSGMPGKMLRFLRFLRRERIDILQVYFPDSTYFGVVAGWLAGVPRVVRTCNNLGHALTPLHRRLGRLCNYLTDFTVANCAACRDATLAAEGPPRKAALVLRNAVDLDRFADVASIGRFRRPARVGVLANLRPVKDLELFVRSAAAVARTHPDTAFAIGGEGELRPRLERLVRSLGLDGRFHLPGAVADVPAFVAGLDICVLCSRSEGLSNALLEYMACGRPVVATAVGATPELIEPGVHGLLVPPGDVDALTGALRRLLDDPVLAARLGAAARRRVEDSYGRAAMVRRFEAFYADCVGRHAA